MQLLICDWLLETRTSLWEDTLDNDAMITRVPTSILAAFQKDFSSLRVLAQHVPVSDKLITNSITIKYKSCTIKNPFLNLMFFTDCTTQSLLIRSNNKADGRCFSRKNPAIAGQEFKK